MADAATSPLEGTATVMPPLVTDLDGTLVRTDTLYETVIFNLFQRPFATILACLALLGGGKAAMKERLAALGQPPASSFPYHEGLVTYLRKERARGRAIHLATASDQSMADRIAEHLGLFDEVIGSSGSQNLKGRAKAAKLTEGFPDGFVYAGDHATDLDVWDVATAAIPVGVSSRTSAVLDARGIKVERRFDQPILGAASLWRTALRMHQWAKNILIFAPLLLTHRYDELAAVLAVFAGFLAMGIVASGTYVLNDLADLANDRTHRTKCQRPFAAGTLPVMHGLVVGPTLIAAGLLLALLIQPALAVLLLVYLGTTLSYTFGLKRQPLIDVFVLGFLYTLRLLMGVAILEEEISPWLISFCFCFFFSMSIAKRHVELVLAKDAPQDELIKGRGYRPSDWPFTLAAGQASSCAAALVIVLYLTEEAFDLGAYRSPEFLWAVPVLILAWTQHIWLLAHRGDLDDDPVSFAVKDPVSIGLGVILSLFFGAAIVL